MTTWRLPDREYHIGSEPLVLGIVNVTPDSFSDGGRFLDVERAVEHGLQLVADGADLLDIGGESTRPGSLPVTLDEEIGRVVPVVEKLAKQIKVPISVDTSKAAVARACCDLGALVINDVTALAGDRDMVAVARSFRAGVILMHMQGTPATMQNNPTYDDPVEDIKVWLERRLETLTQQGLNRESLAIDPGLGFGKTFEHNVKLLRQLRDFTALGAPVCLGVSRKGFIGQMTGKPRDRRLAGSLAIAAHALAHGAAHLLRVHDVAETRDLVRIWAALEGDSKEPRTE